MYDISSSILLDPTHDDFDEWSNVWLAIPPERDCHPAPQGLVEVLA